MKTRSLDQVESSQRKAARFVRDVLGDEERAQEIEDESPESYAARKRILIIKNPAQRRIRAMAQPTKAELEDRIEELESENEELRDKLSAISDVLQDDEDEEADDEDEEN